MHITIALLQMASYGHDQAANLAKGEDFCRKARAMGADLALFPEMWNVGYTALLPEPDNAPNVWRAPELWYGVDPEQAPRYADVDAYWKGLAVSRDGAYIQHFRQLARELNMAIAVTYLEEWPVMPRNSVSLIDRSGEILMTYAKMHTCDFSATEASLTSGDRFEVCTLETEQGSVQIGAMICYDREFPESARILMLQGAEIILVPNACDLEINRLTQFRTRAYENMVGMAMTNYAAPQANGHSIAFDGIAFANGGSRDMLLVEAGEQEGIYLARFDLDALRDYRTYETWANAFRRPHRYNLLTSLEVQPPFIRQSVKGERYDPTRR